MHHVFSAEADDWEVVLFGNSHKEFAAGTVDKDGWYDL